MEKENPSSFFRFSFRATLSFTLMNVVIDQVIYKGKNQSCFKWKTKKTTWVFFSHKHSKYWSISLGQKVEHKPVFSEEWACSISRYTAMWIYICAICTSVALLCLASSGQILLSKQFPHEKCIIRRKIKLLRCELHWIHVKNSECKQDFFVKMHASSVASTITNTENANQLIQMIDFDEIVW